MTRLPPDVQESIGFPDWADTGHLAACTLVLSVEEGSSRAVQGEGWDTWFGFTVYVSDGLGPETGDYRSEFLQPQENSKYKSTLEVRID